MKHDFDWRLTLDKRLAKIFHRARAGGLSVKEAAAREREARNSDPEFLRLSPMVNAYGRDRGEERDVDATVGDTLSEVWPDDDCGTEFTYVFADPDGRGKRWFVGDPDEGQQTLRDLGAVIRGDDEAPKTAIKAFGGNFVIGHR